MKLTVSLDRRHHAFTLAYTSSQASSLFQPCCWQSRRAPVSFINLSESALHALLITSMGLKRAVCPSCLLCHLQTLERTWSQKAIHLVVSFIPAPVLRVSGVLEQRAVGHECLGTWLLLYLTCLQRTSQGPSPGRGAVTASIKYSGVNCSYRRGLPPFAQDVQNLILLLSGNWQRCK